LKSEFQPPPSVVIVLESLPSSLEEELDELLLELELGLLPFGVRTVQQDSCTQIIGRFKKLVLAATAPWRGLTFANPKVQSVSMLQLGLPTTKSPPLRHLSPAFSGR